ncbi:hypothetical protein [uncultured Arthrobacter sp.]|uniref:hypothetical protein n=1 Tax=uncultured Arthrobacter sp. TaxID=114050 RepID=UPI00321621CE
MAKPELADIAAQLYAMPFDAFVAGRNAAAKDMLSATPATPELRSRAAEVRSLPKPSVGAWAVNMLAWQRPEILRDLAELGFAMRRAQADLDAAALRSLSRERRTLLAGAVDAARAVAEQQGRKISGSIAAEVEQTLRAATADEGAAAAVRSGRLLRALSADGVDVVDLDGAVAVPEAGGAMPAAASPPGLSRRASAPPAADQPRLRAVRQERAAPTPSARQRAQAALQEAADDARSSAAEADRTGAELQDANEDVAALAGEARRLKEQLEQAEAGLRQARRRAESAAAAAQQAARAADKARRREDLARERVLRLGNTPGG